MYHIVHQKHGALLCHLHYHEVMLLCYTPSLRTTFYYLDFVNLNFDDVLIAAREVFYTALLNL